MFEKNMKRDPVFYLFDHFRHLGMIFLRWKAYVWDIFEFDLSKQQFSPPLLPRLMSCQSAACTCS